MALTESGQSTVGVWFGHYFTFKNNKPPGSPDFDEDDGEVVDSTEELMTKKVVADATEEFERNSGQSVPNMPFPIRG